MEEQKLREFFADVVNALNISLGPWCDRNQIYRSHFTNWRKGYYNSIDLNKVNNMKNDIINNLESIIKIYKSR